MVNQRRVIKLSDYKLQLGINLIFCFLLQAGANPLDKSVNGRTALHDAVVGGYKDCLKMLLDYTAEVNVRDREGMTPAHVAAFNGELGCIKILQDRGMLDCR